MVEIIVLSITSLIFLLVIMMFGKAFINKESIIGHPTIPLFYFILAKIFPFCNLIFLLLRGLKVQINVLYTPPVYVDYIALAFLVTGMILAFLTSSILKDDLIFGLPKTEKHKLQTKGVYSISRHPFYLGFLLILFSSVLFVPNILNIILFVFAWLLHHFIMIKEEEFLISKYGEEYKLYMKKVKRYINIF